MKAQDDAAPAPISELECRELAGHWHAIANAAHFAEAAMKRAAFPQHRLDEARTIAMHARAVANGLDEWASNLRAGWRPL